MLSPMPGGLVFGIEGEITYMNKKKQYLTVPMCYAYGQKNLLLLLLIIFDN